MCEGHRKMPLGCLKQKGCTREPRRNLIGAANAVSLLRSGSHGSPDPTPDKRRRAQRGRGPRVRPLHMAEAISVSAKVGNQSISLKTGRVAKQADGSLAVRSGDRIVLVTAISATQPKPGLAFIPMTLDYQYRLSEPRQI